MKTEVRRGRKFVEYIDDSLPVGTFVQEIGVHDVSYQDENSVWQPIDESWETDGQDGFSFRAQRMKHKVRFDSIGAWRWYPRRNVETEYIIINRPKCWLTRTSRWGNLLVNGISREGRDITLTSLRNVTRVIHSSWNGIKTDWILESADAPTRFQQQIDIVGLTEVDGWLYGADGEQVARLTPTTAIDAEGNELPTSTSYENGTLEFSADVTGAVFPVVIDPDYISATTSVSIYGNSTASYADARSTAAVFSTTQLIVGQYKRSTRYRVHRGLLKFDTSSLTSSATVTQVNLKLTAGTVPTTHFDVQIVKQDWSGQDPITSSNLDAAYDNCLSGTADDSIWQNTSGLSPDTQYTSGNLDNYWVNKTGTTYYSLRSSLDVSSTAPIVETEVCYVYPAIEAAGSYRPVLAVTYTGGSPQNLTLTCAAGSYALTGTSVTLTATVKQNLTLACSAGSYSLTGTNADLTVTRHYTLSVGGAYPDIAVSGAGTSDANGTYTYAGTSNGKPYYILGNSAIMWVGLGFQAWGVYVNSVAVYKSTDDVATPDLCTTWTVVNTGIAPVPTVTIATTYTLTGTDATLTYTQGAQSYTLTCEAGSYSLTGTNADLTVTRHYTLTCSAGSYSLTGTNADFEVKRNYTLECASGSYSLTGSNVDLIVQHNYTLTLESGSYSLTGSDVTLDPTFHYSLTLESGSYTLTGTDVTLTKTTGAQSYTLSLEAGTYSLTGTNAGLTSSRTMALASGSYTLTGTNAGFYRALVMACEAGSYALTSSDASLTSHRIFALGMGSYVLVGTSVGLFILSPTPACRTATIEFENRTFAIPHENRTATIEYENRTLEVKCH